MIPARWAPSTFSFSPPIGSTRPRSVISPVIATSRRTGRPDIALTSAVEIATPALGPSFGIAPAGTWTCTSIEPSRSSGIFERRRVRRRVGERGARALLHHVAELAGEDERHVAPSAHLHLLVRAVGRALRAVQPADRRLDEHDVAAHRRVVHAGRHADLVLLVRALGVHARPAEQLAHVLGAMIVEIVRPARRELARDLARHRADLALELTHAALARVVATRCSSPRRR